MHPRWGPWLQWLVSRPARIGPVFCCWLLPGYDVGTGAQMLMLLGDGDA